MIAVVRVFGVSVLVGLWAFAPQVRAQALDIAPISQTLDSTQRTASFTLVNRSQRPTQVQIRPYQWSQQGGQDQLSATTDLLVSPPFAQIAPGQTQIVRMLVNKPGTGPEQAFRVMFDQLPDADTSQVQLTFRLIVPVFVKGAAQGSLQVPATVAWRLYQSAGQVLLSASNSGTQHLRLIDLKLLDDQGRSFVLHSKQLPYLLAGSTDQWQVADPGHLLRGGARLHLTTRGRVDSQDTWLTLAP